MMNIKIKKYLSMKKKNIHENKKKTIKNKNKKKRGGNSRNTALGTTLGVVTALGAAYFGYGKVKQIFHEKKKSQLLKKIL